MPKENLDSAIYTLYKALDHRNDDSTIRSKVKEALKFLHQYKTDLEKETYRITVSNEKRDLPI